MRRNVVERGFCQLRHWRGAGHPLEEHARNYAGAPDLPALQPWLS